MHGNVALINIETGMVENYIIVNDNYNPPNGFAIIPIPDNVAVWVGDLWDGAQFIDMHTEKQLLESLEPTASDIKTAEIEIIVLEILMKGGLL